MGSNKETKKDKSQIADTSLSTFDFSSLSDFSPKTETVDKYFQNASMPTEIPTSLADSNTMKNINSPEAKSVAERDPLDALRLINTKYQTLRAVDDATLEKQRKAKERIANISTAFGTLGNFANIFSGAPTIKPADFHAKPKKDYSESVAELEKIRDRDHATEMQIAIQGMNYQSMLEQRETDRQTQAEQRQLSAQLQKDKWNQNVEINTLRHEQNKEMSSIDNDYAVKRGAQNQSDYMDRLRVQNEALANSANFKSEQAQAKADAKEKNSRWQYGNGENDYTTPQFINKNRKSIIDTILATDLSNGVTERASERAAELWSASEKDLFGIAMSRREGRDVISGGVERNGGQNLSVDFDEEQKTSGKFYNTK